MRKLSGAQSNTSNPDVLIIGGGLHGLSASIHLSLAGFRCSIIEKDYSGRHASGVNAGGVRRLGRHSAEIPLSSAALDYWHRMVDWLGDDCGFVPCDQIKVAETEDELSLLEQRVSSLKQSGYDHELMIDRDQLRGLVPALSTHCQGAIWCPGDGSANPFRTVCAFRNRAIELGVSIHNDHVVKSVKRQGNVWEVGTHCQEFQAPIIINAAGAWGNKIANMIGDDVPMQAEAFMLMITERVKPMLTQVLGATGRTLSFKQFDNGTFMIGGGHIGHADRVSNQALVDTRGLSTSAHTVKSLFPQLNNIKINRFWAGLEGVTPDGIPVIGPARNADNAYHVFGFCGHGFQLSPITGHILTQLVEAGNSSLSIDSFRVDRFSQLDVHKDSNKQ